MAWRRGVDGQGVRAEWGSGTEPVPHAGNAEPVRSRSASVRNRGATFFLLRGAVFNTVWHCFQYCFTLFPCQFRTMEGHRAWTVCEQCCTESKQCINYAAQCWSRFRVLEPRDRRGSVFWSCGAMTARRTIGPVFWIYGTIAVPHVYKYILLKKISIFIIFSSGY